MTDEEADEMKDNVKEILRIMNGNGKLGMCAKVNVMWGLGVFMLMTIAAQAFILTRLLMSS